MSIIGWYLTRLLFHGLGICICRMASIWLLNIYSSVEVHELWKIRRSRAMPARYRVVEVVEGVLGWRLKLCEAEEKGKRAEQKKSSRGAACLRPDWEKNPPGTS